MWGPLASLRLVLMGLAARGVAKRIKEDISFSASVTNKLTSSIPLQAPLNQANAQQNLAAQRVQARWRRNKAQRIIATQWRRAHQCIDANKIEFTHVIASTFHVLTNFARPLNLDAFESQVTAVEAIVRELVLKVEKSLLQAQGIPYCETLRVILGPEFMFRIPFQDDKRDKTPPLTANQADHAITRIRNALHTTLDQMPGRSSSVEALLARWVVVPGTIYWGSQKLDREEGFNVFNVAPMIYRQSQQDQVALFAKMKFSRIDGQRAQEREGWLYYQGIDDPRANEHGKAKTELINERVMKRAQRRKELFKFMEILAASKTKRAFNCPARALWGRKKTQIRLNSTQLDALPTACSLLAGLQPAWTPFFIGNLKVSLDICLDVRLSTSRANLSTPDHAATRVLPLPIQQKRPQIKSGLDGFNLALLTSAGMDLNLARLRLKDFGLFVHSDHRYDEAAQLIPFDDMGHARMGLLARRASGITSDIDFSIWEPRQVVESRLG